MRGHLTEDTIGSTPKRTRIGEGRTVRNKQGRTKRSPSRKRRRGQGH